MTKTRQNVRAQDIEVGCILFLPKSSFTGDLKCIWSDVNGHPCQNHGACVLKQEGHGHPVVIIGKHYKLDGNTLDIPKLSFVQMTHGTPERPITSGPSIFSPYGHYERTGNNGRLTFPRSLRSRYWFRDIEFLQLGPGNFRIPHVFFACPGSLETMTAGPEARAYDSRLDTGSYQRLMQRLNLEPKPYVLDGYWNRGWPALSNGNSTEHEQPYSHADTSRPSGVEPAGSSNQPHGHRIANHGCVEYNLESYLIVPILDPAPSGNNIL
ncbi:hypothetical protein QC760_005323 [Botrytis cinerea]